MKTLNAFLILSLLVVCCIPSRAQSGTTYKVQMLVGKDKNVEAKSAELWLEDGGVKIRVGKKNSEAKYISFGEIESADYTYSDRPRYTAATLGTIAFGITALPIFFMKTKKNWLTINAGENSAILQLQSENYQMLLLKMQSKGVKISDSGDLDDREKEQKAEKSKKSN